ncbi:MULTISPECIES: cobalamin-dependent protein [unclassified Streptomyces]|uniref:cobalamin B12-binding domain-containing protein n=1 Tax=unclassified Streptomyces TaxID=2593676 RepID=UPI000DB9F81D|nr:MULTISPECIES: cobalamin-dependent protein [unclassified Streptomyces]MYT74638.1 cobalamin-binding protein [Streptomyces sp. SID8367]RAJ91622.1 methanogenic corrinoid protein MtbC1 [Streptomyces sp. PsTaAH-137]
MSTQTDTRAGDAGPSPDELREQLWQAAIDCDETHAVALVRHAVGPSTSPDVRAAAERTLLELIAPVQERVGVQWAANNITVAQEHAATAINERCVSAVADVAASAPVPADGATAPLGRVTVACVDGEWHALPARLVTEVLRLRGWHVDYLGAQVPTEHLIAHLHQRPADAVLLSSSIPSHLPTAHTAISACQAAGVPVVVGGAAFGPQGRYAQRMQAAWAPDAVGAHTLLRRGLDRPTADAARLPDLDLPHLNDQEYTLVRQSKRQLVKQTLTDVEEAFPPMRSYTAYQRERTAEDIDHIVGYLATAVYVDDAELFTTFIAWTAGILQARRVPARSLLPALDSLRHQLKDFPRATHMLTAARGALTVPGPGQPV